MSMTLATALRHSISTKIAAIKVTARVWTHFWALAGSIHPSTYYAATSTVNGRRAVVGILEGVGDAITGAWSGMNEVASIAAVDVLEGSYFWNEADNRVYINPTGSGATAYTNTYMIRYEYRFATESKAFDGERPFKNRVKSVPTMKIATASEFGKRANVSSGTVALGNQDGYLNSLIDDQLDFDGEELTVELGIDTGQGDMAYTEYVPLYTWRIVEWDLGSEISFSVEEITTATKISLPIHSYSLGETDDESIFQYKNLDTTTIGDKVPILYGTVRDVPCTCIDTEISKFRICSNGIETLLDARANGSVIGVTSVNEVAGTFIYAEWDGTAIITVDAVGIYRNPADIIEDILITHMKYPASKLHIPGSGEDPIGFGANGSRIKWTQSTEDPSGEDVPWPDVGLFINEATDGFDIIERVLQAAFGIFYTDTGGLFVLRAWEPLASEGTTELLDADISDAKQTVDITKRYTRVVARYKIYKSIDTSQLTIFGDDSIVHTRGLEVHSTLEEDLPFDEVQHAEWWSEWTALAKGRPVRLWDVKCNQKALLLRPGDPVQLTKTKRGMNGYFEVISTTHQPGTSLVTLRVSQWRGFNIEAGFWADSSPVFPGYLGGGDASVWDSGWTTLQKIWAMENIGYWTDDNGFIDPTDPESYTNIWV